MAMVTLKRSRAMIPKYLDLSETQRCGSSLPQESTHGTLTFMMSFSFVKDLFNEYLVPAVGWLFSW